mgnify:CR=1 FL=1
MVIRESGDVQGALDHLDLYHQSICDKINLKEIGNARQFLGKPALSEELILSGLRLSEKRAVE